MCCRTCNTSASDRVPDDRLSGSAQRLCFFQKKRSSNNNAFLKKALFPKQGASKKAALLKQRYSPKNHPCKNAGAVAKLLTQAVSGEWRMLILAFRMLLYTGSVRRKSRNKIARYVFRPMNSSVIQRTKILSKGLPLFLASHCV